MSFVAVSAGAAVFGTAANVIGGMNQKKKANQIRSSAIDPGIIHNYSLDRVTNTLSQNYSNYNLSGYGNMVNQIGSSQASSNRDASLAATSSADVLNSITQNQVAATNALGAINLENASGRERALMMYLGAVEKQGQDQIRVNQADNSRYNAEIAEAAALEGAGTININQGIQDSLLGVSALANSFAPRQAINPGTGQVVQMPSVWESYRNRRKGA